MFTKKVVFYTILVVTSVASTFLFGEILVRVFSPAPSLYPRYKFSSTYGFQVYEDTKMVHTLPSKYTFLYSVNKYGYRGKAIDPAQYDQKTVLVLGDSNSFGIGVNDGEEYPAKLAEALKEDYIVVNLANPGWGLTQEIRRYYDFGILYHPIVVILQFDSNDIDDNFDNMVTTVKDGRFIFHNSGNKVNVVKRYLSQSIIQKSQLYNFVRQRTFDLYEKWYVRRAESKYRVEWQDKNLSSPKEEFYNTLLTAFADDLCRNNIRLLFISVNNKLNGFPHVEANIYRLHAEGKLNYVDVRPWFEGVPNYESAEGHVWGRKAHTIIGRNLASTISMLNDQYSQTRIVP